MKATQRRPARLAEVGAVYTFEEAGRFGACQVVRVEAKKKGGDQAEIATLDWLEARPPKPTDKLAILRQDWGYWNGGLARCNVEARVPWWVTHAFTAEVVEKVPGDCTSYGGWHTARGAFRRDAWSKRPKREKVDTTMVNVDLGGGARAMRKDTSRVTIAPDGKWALVLPAKGEPRLDALDVLGNLSEITFHGPSMDLAKWTKHRELESLTWMAHGQTSIDLSATSLDSLTLEVTGKLAVALPKTLRSLTLTGDVAEATLEGLDARYPFSLSLVGRRMATPRGVGEVESVTFSGLVEGDTRALADLPKLKELTLRGAPGVLEDSRGFGALRELRELTAYDVYGLDAARFPTAWPSLDAVTLHGIEKTEAEALKRAFVEVPAVAITGARTKAWMEANLGNPFREWEEDDEDFGRAACAAWRKAKKATVKLGPKAKKKDAEAALKAFVSALNRLDGDGCIDTLRREEAAEVFLELAAGCGIDDATAEKWFDAWRDF